MNLIKKIPIVSGFFFTSIFMKEFVFLKKGEEKATSNLIVVVILAILVIMLTTPIIVNWQAKYFYSNPNFSFFKQLLPFSLGCLVFFIGQKLLFKKPILHLFTSRSSFDWKRFLMALFIWGLILSSLLMVHYLIVPSDFLFQFEARTFFSLTLISLIFVTIQTLFEELLFRSLLLHAFGSFIKQKIIICLFISLLFTSLHLSNPEIRILGPTILIYYFLTSMFLSLITILDNGIELSFGFHAINNLFGSLILTNNWQVFQTKALFVDISPPEISWDIWFILLFLYPLLIFLYLKITRTKFGSIFDSKQV